MPFTEPLLQLLIAACGDTGAADCITAALAFLLLLCHNDFCKVIAMLSPKNAAYFSVLPKKAVFAVFRAGSIVAHPINNFDSLMFHSDTLLNDFGPETPGNDKSPVMTEIITGLCKVSSLFLANHGARFWIF